MSMHVLSAITDITGLFHSLISPQLLNLSKLPHKTYSYIALHNITFCSELLYLCKAALHVCNSLEYVLPASAVVCMCQLQALRDARKTMCKFCLHIAIKKLHEICACKKFIHGFRMHTRSSQL